MANYSDAPMDQLWKEYSVVFRDYDDLTLARWMAQTLGQLEGRIWRMSHPLVGTYRLASQQAHDRQIWHKRLVTPPRSYAEASCCRAPLLPMFTRDIHEAGLICQHCGDTCIPFEDMGKSLQREIRSWIDQYTPVHAVAHWDDTQRKNCANYEVELDKAAESAERLLATAVQNILPKLLDSYPTVIWEDQDECLEVRPEDIQLT